MKNLIMHDLSIFLSSKYWGGFWTAAIGWGWSFIAPVWTFIILTAVLTTADMITGIFAAHKRQEIIHSKKIGRTVEKMLVFLSLLLVCNMLGQTFEPLSSLTYMAAFAISTKEFKSISENVHTVTGLDFWGKATNLFNKKEK